jgi:hypothetical protein
MHDLENVGIAYNGRIQLNLRHFLITDFSREEVMRKREEGNKRRKRGRGKGKGGERRYSVPVKLLSSPIWKTWPRVTCHQRHNLVLLASPLSRRFLRCKRPLQPVARLGLTKTARKASLKIPRFS